jgi:hypothetical protein
MQRRVSEKMGEHHQDPHDAVRNGKDIHIEENGWRVDGINHWLWTGTTRITTIYPCPHS